MDQATLEDFRTRLVAMSRRLREDAAAIAEEARGGSEGENAGDLSHYPLHLGDRGTEEFLVDLNATTLESQAQLLDETLAAIERIDAGSFGICQDCGKEIDVERLEVLLSTPLCIDCARRAEKQLPSVDRGRPHSPADTIAPEGEMNERGREDRSLFAEMSSVRTAAGGGDRHATGTAGGGTPFGGLAGGTQGRGEPDVAELSNAHASSEAQRDEAFDGDQDLQPRSGHAGGAVGGTPVNKRSRPRE